MYSSSSYGTLDGDNEVVQHAYGPVRITRNDELDMDLQQRMSERGNVVVTKKPSNKIDEQGYMNEWNKYDASVRGTRFTGDEIKRMIDDINKKLKGMDNRINGIVEQIRIVNKTISTLKSTK